MNNCCPEQLAIINPHSAFERKPYASLKHSCPCTAPDISGEGPLVSARALDPVAASRRSSPRGASVRHPVERRYPSSCQRTSALAHAKSRSIATGIVKRKERGTGRNGFRDRQSWLVLKGEGWWRRLTEGEAILRLRVSRCLAIASGMAYLGRDKGRETALLHEAHPGLSGSQLALWSIGCASGTGDKSNLGLPAN